MTLHWPHLHRTRLLAIFELDCVLLRILTSDFHHQTFREKKVYKIGSYVWNAVAIFNLPVDIYSL